MRAPDYTPSVVARTLRDPDTDRDLAIDLERVARRLTPTDRRFLSAWAKGYSTREANIEAGLRGNGVLRLRALLRKLTRLLNEGSEP
jgi:hypothetical protein